MADPPSLAPDICTAPQPTDRPAPYLTTVVRIRRFLSTHYGFLITLLFLALYNLALRLLNLPLNRVIELRYCNAHFLEHDPSVINPDGQIDEQLCKIDPIQQKLAWLEAFIGTSITVCDLIVTVPYGVISDRLGRRLVLGLNVVASAVLFAWILLIGKVNILPVEAMIAAPFLALFGGGECVFASTMFAFLTNASQDATTRTTYFAYAGSLSYVFSLLGPYSRYQYAPSFLDQVPKAPMKLAPKATPTRKLLFFAQPMARMGRPMNRKRSPVFIQEFSVTAEIQSCFYQGNLDSAISLASYLSLP
ncbi:hypothetical protein F5B20DRAFT_593088 [Whalleya microplaca]|nr:hypothetical protein F5B20DRAFT_593088 [Whalleya microplaca]